MNLRKKTILIIALAICIILLATIATSNLVVLDGFRKIEQEDTQTQIERATNAFNAESVALDNFVVDYATWDDTYMFILNNNTQYIESNLIDQTFVHSDLNVMVFVNSTGQIVYSKTYGIVDPNNAGISQNISDFFVQKQLWRLDENNTYMRGLLYYSDSLFVVSSRPILTSQAEGPIQGAVIMARQLTPGRISALEDQTHLNIAVSNLQSRNLASNFQEAERNLPKTGSFFLKPINETVINGYTTLPDIMGNPDIIFEVSLQRSIYNEGVTTTNTFLILTAALFAVFGIIIIFNIERSVLSRITKLKESVGKVKEAGNVEERGVLNDTKFNGKKDEMSSLSLAINEMLDRLEDMTVKLQKSQRLAAVGELSVMIAHDLRNPLQSIKIADDCLKSEKFSDPDKKLKMINHIGSDVLYCEKIVNDLLGYSGNLKIFPSETYIKSLVSTSMNHIQLPENVKVNNLTQDEPKINLDSEKMLRVFDNLIKNAVDAMPQGGNLNIRSTFSSDRVHLSFEDNGKGIEKENLSKLFTPLFTTKAKGMGFGLAICQRIIEAHKGTISVESTPNQGTTFKIELPLNLPANFEE